MELGYVWERLERDAALYFGKQGKLIRSLDSDSS